MQGLPAAAQASTRHGLADPRSSYGKVLYIGNLASSVSQETLQVWGAVAHSCILTTCLPDTYLQDVHNEEHEMIAIMLVCTERPCWPVTS